MSFSWRPSLAAAQVGLRLRHADLIAVDVVLETSTAHVPDGVRHRHAGQLQVVVVVLESGHHLVSQAAPASRTAAGVVHSEEVTVDARALGDLHPDRGAFNLGATAIEETGGLLRILITRLRGDPMLVRRRSYARQLPRSGVIREVGDIAVRVANPFRLVAMFFRAR